MLLLIASIECQEDRDLIAEFHKTKLNLLYHEAGKFISGKENIEDVVYDTFVKIIEKIDVFKSLHPKQRDKYATVAVRNLCYLHLRKEQHFSIVSFDELLETTDVIRESDPERITEQRLFNQQIHSIISQLDTEERLLLEQKYILHWTDTEMAQLYGIKTNSLRMKLTRAKRSLFKQIQEQGFQLGDWKV